MKLGSIWLWLSIALPIRVTSSSYYVSLKYLSELDNIPVTATRNRLQRKSVPVPPVPSKANKINSNKNHAVPLDGLTFSPYEENGCRSPSLITEQIISLNKMTTHLRLYDIDCDQLKIALEAIKHHKLRLKLLPGLWTRDLKESIATSTKKLSDIINSDPSYRKFISGIAVGNEDLFQGKPESEIINKIATVKSVLSRNRLGDLKVGTAEIPTRWTSNLAAASDIIYANIYSFFDQPDVHRSVTMMEAAERIINHVNILKNKYPNKLVIITETGWPTTGSASQPILASPDPNHQGQFLEYFICLATKHKYHYYILEAFDSHWKKGPTVEQHFGLIDNTGKFKYTQFKDKVTC